MSFFKLKQVLVKEINIYYNKDKSIIRTNNKIFYSREFVVGENDIKNLFIYSIDEEIPVNTVIKRKQKKGWYRVLNTPSGITPFYF